MSYPIDIFIQALASEKIPGNVFNQYQLTRDPIFIEANEVRRHNLKLYLDQMVKLKPQYILVGEAPGYRGCRRTGVPFTSEIIMLEGIDPIPSFAAKFSGNASLFGQERGYRLAADSKVSRCEATATMVWQELIRYWPPPLLWNAFPFHPHQAENLHSNRAPVSAELTLGLSYLRTLADIFDLTIFVAVGKSAKRVLELGGINGKYIRHPSRGGKRKFAEGLAGLTRPMDELHYTSAHASDID